jgi:CheY-like chemotaxis protein
MPAPIPIPHVLLVEDNLSCARLTELTLEEDMHGDVTVTHARSLAEALDVLAADEGSRPHVVVADLGLPDAHGLDVVARLRTAGAPPIIVLSGLDADGIGAALEAAGAVAHVLKGNEHHALAAAITAAVTRA